jgi:UDP-galactopyranose mutase
METPSLNLVDSSFEHVLHSYGPHLFSTYKYEIGKYFFDFISYLLGNYLSFFELRQNNMAHLNQCLLLNTKKNQQCCI